MLPSTDEAPEFDRRRQLGELRSVVESCRPNLPRRGLHRLAIVDGSLATFDYSRNGRSAVA